MASAETTGEVGNLTSCRSNILCRASHLDAASIETVLPVENWEVSLHKRVTGLKPVDIPGRKQLLTVLRRRHTEIITYQQFGELVRCNDCRSLYQGKCSILNKVVRSGNENNCNDPEQLIGFPRGRCRGDEDVVPNDSMRFPIYD